MKHFLALIRPRLMAGRYTIGRNRYTARRQRLFDLCAVFLFLLLLPYACSLLFGRDEGLRETVELAEEQPGLWVVCREPEGEKKIPMETYIQGALAASIPADCSYEALKAQAVILRTLCIHAYENRPDSADRFIRASEVGQRYAGAGERQRLWGSTFEEREALFASAVSDTAGMYLTWQERTMEPAYFWLSAGRTRDGQEVLGREGEGMVSVDCPGDSQAEDFEQTLTVEEQEFWERLGMEPGRKIILTRDSAGYVLQVTIGGEDLSGEKFRTLFGLPSSCFFIEGADGQVRITTRGVGHGLGFCQHEADRLAAEGAGWEELLQTFFKDAQIRKTE